MFHFGGTQLAGSPITDSPCGVQGHDAALDKLPSKVAAVIPRDQLEHAISAAGLPAKGARFVNLAEVAALEALQVSHRCPLPSCLHMSYTLTQRRSLMIWHLIVPCIITVHLPPSVIHTAVVPPGLLRQKVLMDVDGGLQDADWAPVSDAERQACGVSIGSGLSCTSELAEAGSFALQGLVRK